MPRVDSCVLQLWFGDAWMCSVAVIMAHRTKMKVSGHTLRGCLEKLMASAFDDTWLQSNAVVEPPTAPEEFDGDLDDIQRFIAYTKSSQPGPRLVAVQTFLWLCAHSSLAYV